MPRAPVILWHACTAADRVAFDALVAALDVRGGPTLPRAFTSVDALDTALAAARRHEVPQVVAVSWLAEVPDAARLAAWHRRVSGLRVVVVGMGGEGALSGALAAGFDAYLDLGQPLETGLRALRAVQRGGLWLSGTDVAHLRRCLHRVPPGTPTGVAPRLTERERAVLRLIGAGLSQPQIAVRLALSPGTVGTYVRRLYDKLGAHTAGAAVLAGVRHGLLHP